MATLAEQQTPDITTEAQAAAGAPRDEPANSGSPVHQPLEMNDLNSSSAAPAGTTATAAGTAPTPATVTVTAPAPAPAPEPASAPVIATAPAAPVQNVAQNPESTALKKEEQADKPSSLAALSPPTHAPLDRTETAELALGPDGSAPPAGDSSTPTLRITLMLTTGARHAYTISQKYLTSRKVEAKDAEGNFDPREMSGYKLKELIWTDWRPEWEPRPRDPSSIRLIIMGRMMDDKVALKDLPFSLTSSNVVHMTIKPADLLEDETEGAGKGSKGSIRAHNTGDEGGAGCRCVIL